MSVPIDWKKAEFLDIHFDGLIPALTAGETDERKQQVEFIVSYFNIT